MDFNSNLVSTDEIESFDFKSSIKGSYNTMQFVLRLSDDVRYQLNNEDQITPERLQAFSTYLHENIHWWQHIGSNFGFIFSTSYPAFAATSIEHLKKLIEKKIIYKSLSKFDSEYYASSGKSDIEDLNVIMNDYHDLENAKKFSMDNKLIKEMMADRRFFLSIGHCYMILWTKSIFLLSETVDKNHNFLPKTNDWIAKFEEASAKKIEGFYPDSSYHVSPIGIKAIFEGQAIFNQIVYLKNAFKQNNVIFSDFIKSGLLHGIYLEAFDVFLNIINEERPVFLDDNILSLFLLVCDLSINPNNGFPLDIYDINNFILKNDPGLRFFFICRIILKDKGHYLAKCNEPTKETYIDLTKLISKKLGCISSYESLSNVISWSKQPEIQELLEEEKRHAYEEVNMPFRFFLAKYIRFQEDKYENPHIFCWIGHHLSIDSVSNIPLFEKHATPFVDSEDGEIKPLIFSGVDETNLYNTFNKFYQHTIVYELILKWVSEEGEFKLDYKWLFNTRNDENIPLIKKEFKDLFGVELDEIEIV